MARDMTNIKVNAKREQRRALYKEHLGDNGMDEWTPQWPQPQPEDVMLDSEQDDASDMVSHKEGRKTSEEMTIEQVRALGKQFDYDSSKFTPEQRRAIYKVFFALYLEIVGLRSPQHYPYFGEKSEPASASDDAWPGEVAIDKVNFLKRGYIEPEDLIKRLGKLKPSDNFELRKRHYPPIQWEKSPLHEKSYTIRAPEPD
ncbi:MAG: hypothetical protein Q9163_003463 [Psora crenata]